jgi:tetratricopeptide (TPR) repeat protein
MELRQEIKQRLRTARSWPSLIEELEREVDSVEEPKEAKAQRLYELGQLCEDVFLRKDRAMVHYQRAFKLSQTDLRALDRARSIYREMGNLEMVATLLGLELRVASDAAQRAQLEGLLGIARLDLGQRDQALQHLEAAAAALPDDVEVQDALRAANYDREDWLGEAERLTKQAERADSATAARIMMRVARIYRLEVPADPSYLEALQKVVANEPQHEQANFLLEGALGAQKRFDDIVKLHESRAFACADEREQAELYRRFASMWALRWNDIERSAHFYRKALQAYYGDAFAQGARFLGHLAAFGFLREIEGPKGEWAKLLAIADLGLRAGLSEDEQAFLAAQAGTISWKEMRDSDKAKGYFAEVERINPESEDLHAFMRDTASGTIEKPSTQKRANALMAALGGAAAAAPTNGAQKGNAAKHSAKSEEPMDEPREEVPEELPPIPPAEPVPASEPEVRASAPTPKAEPVVAKAEPVVAKAEPVVAKAEPVVAKAEPETAAKIEEPVAKAPEPKPTKTEERLPPKSEEHPATQATEAAARGLRRPRSKSRPRRRRSWSRATRRSPTSCARRWTLLAAPRAPAPTRASRPGASWCRRTRRFARRAASCSGCTRRPSAGTRSSSCSKRRPRSFPTRPPTRRWRPSTRWSTSTRRG